MYTDPNLLLKPLPTYSEAELVQLLNQRSQQGFSYLYENYSGALLGIISGIVPDAQGSEDVLQEVFVRFFRKIETYDAGKSRLFTWMAQIARNAAIDWVRKEQQMPKAKNQMAPDDVTEYLPQAGLNPDTIGVAQWVAQLEEGERQVVRLAYYDGLTQDEISKQLAIPLGTVKSRVRSGLKKLRMMMSES